MPTDSIHIRLTAHQIAMARIYVLYIIPLKQKTGWLILAGVALISLAVNFLFVDSMRFQTLGELLFGIFALGGSWFLLNYTGERGRKEVVRMYTDGFSLSLKPGGVLYQVGEAHEVLQWSNFESVLATKDWIYLYFTSRQALLIPRAAFTDQNQYQAWVQALNLKISKDQNSAG